MRIRFLIPALIILLLVPFAARAIDQNTIDRFVFLLQQPEWDMWGDGIFDDNALLDGFDIIYQDAVTQENDILQRRVIWAMGETGLVPFAPTIIGALPDEPVSACYALGKIPSVDGVYALIEMLDDDDMQVRDAAVWGLGKVPYSADMEDARDDAITALDARLELEVEDWVLEDIVAAIEFIQTGIAINEAFLEESE